MKIPNYSVVVLFITLTLSYACQDNSGTIKLTSDERFTIDTTVNSTLAKMSADLEKWCKDSTPIFRQRYIDSLVIVREQEALKQLPVQNTFSMPTQ